MLTGAQYVPYHVRPRHKSSLPSSVFKITAISILIFSRLCILASSQPQEAIQQLLKFKSGLANADPALSNWDPSVPPCPPQGNAQGNWYGVICFNGHVLGLQLESLNLRGHIDVDSLAPLRFLRTLSLMNNEFEGSMPDWRKLGALKSLYLSNNWFSGELTEDAFKGMASMKKIHLANNRLTGRIPVSIKSPRLMELRLEYNQFTGTIPPISSEFLKYLNVSHNQLEGPIPPGLTKFDPSSFAGNRALCGDPLGAACNPPIPPPEVEPNVHPSAISSPIPGHKKGLSGATMIFIGVCILHTVFFIVFGLLLYRRRQNESQDSFGEAGLMAPIYNEPKVVAVIPSSPEETAPVARPEQQQQQQQSNKLTFVQDNRQKFDLQEMMRASAEVLGSGSFGATYKAILVDGDPVVVKRFKQMNKVAKEDFLEHMRRLGRIDHPNLLPIVAYLYRKEEKLFVFDYMFNGSLSHQLHGKHTEEYQGLSWPVRLTIIKGVANGLLHLQRELPSLTVAHGHLKSSNVVLDKQFNPLLMDYTLVPIVNPNQVHQILVAYKSPEYVQHSRTSKKTDVWCLGILILEALTGKCIDQTSAGVYGAELAQTVNEIIQDGNDDDNRLVYDKQMSVESSCIPEVEKLLRIGLACCQEDLDQRLDLEQAVRQIEQVQES